MEGNLVPGGCSLREERQILFVVIRGHYKKGGLDPRGVQHFQHGRGRFAGAVVKCQADPFLREGFGLRWDG